MSDPIRIVLVDDEAMVRVGLRMVLSGESDLEVVGEAGDGAEAVDVVLETRPDVVLMDVRMPRVDGIEGSRRVAEVYIEATEKMANEAIEFNRRLVQLSAGAARRFWQVAEEQRSQIYTH